MDLSRWSLRQLVREARRLGLSHPESLTREALVRGVERVLRVAGFNTEVPPPPPSAATPSTPHASTPHPSTPPHSAAPTTSQRPPGTTSEPIQTRTMARLLAEQGHRRRALAIYDRLLAREPRDLALREEAEALRQQAEADDDDADDEEGEVVSLAVPGSQILVSWALGFRALSRARDQLGRDAPLAARLVVVSPDETHVVRSELREQHGVSEMGEWLVEDLPAGSRATAAVGLLDGERFVSIAHAPPVRPVPD